MAIYVNGKKIAGRGMQGEKRASPYEITQQAYAEAGREFNIDEETYNSYLINVGEIANNCVKTEGSTGKFIENSPLIYKMESSDSYSELANTIYVDDEISKVKTSIVTDIWSRGDTPPSNSRIFWINANNNGLYFYSGNPTDDEATITNPNNWTLIPALWS